MSEFQQLDLRKGASLSFESITSYVPLIRALLRIINVRERDAGLSYFSIFLLSGMITSWASLERGITIDCTLCELFIENRWSHDDLSSTCYNSCLFGFGSNKIINGWQ